MTRPGFANAIGHHLSQMRRSGNTPPPEADIYDDRLALRETIRRKAEKRYDSACTPLDLLIYIDGVFHPPGMRPEWARTILQEVVTKQRWAGLWLYDTVYDKVIATWARD